MLKPILWITLSILTLIATHSYADCEQSFVCDEDGYCDSIDVCDDVLDLPSVDLPAYPSVSSPGLKPLPSISLPPLGTTKCRQMVVNGRWQEVCI